MTLLSVVMLLGLVSPVDERRLLECVWGTTEAPPCFGIYLGQRHFYSRDCSSPVQGDSSPLTKGVCNKI